MHSLLLGLQRWIPIRFFMETLGDSYLDHERRFCSCGNPSHSSIVAFLVGVHCLSLTTSMGIPSPQLVCSPMGSDGNHCESGTILREIGYSFFPCLLLPPPTRLHIASFYQEPPCKFTPTSPPVIHSQKSLNLNGNINVAPPLLMITIKPWRKLCKL